MSEQEPGYEGFNEEEFSKIVIHLPKAFLNKIRRQADIIEGTSVPEYLRRLVIRDMVSRPIPSGDIPVLIAPEEAAELQAAFDLSEEQNTDEDL